MFVLFTIEKQLIITKYVNQKDSWLLIVLLHNNTGIVPAKAECIA